LHGECRKGHEREGKKDAQGHERTVENEPRVKEWKLIALDYCKAKYGNAGISSCKANG